MRGSKKSATLAKLDRQNVASLYLTPRLKEIYDDDPYKYLIHIVKAYPDDRFRVIQFLTLKFHPLLLKICQKYIKKQISMDWTDLLSFAKYSFVELVYRFDLDSTLYFRTYMPLALDRAINDYHVYNLRRHGLESAIRLEDLQLDSQETLMQESRDIQGISDAEPHRPTASDTVIEYKRACLKFVDAIPEMTQEDRILLAAYLNGTTRLETFPRDQKTRIRRGMCLLKQHLRGDAVDNS